MRDVLVECYVELSDSFSFSVLLAPSHCPKADLPCPQEIMMLSHCDTTAWCKVRYKIIFHHLGHFEVAAAKFGVSHFISHWGTENLR